MACSASRTPTSERGGAIIGPVFCRSTWTKAVQRAAAALLCSQNGRFIDPDRSTSAMLWPERYATWRRRNDCRLRECRHLKNHIVQYLNGMGVAAKQTKKGAALSRGEKKSTFFSFRCPHSPPSEIRQAWSELTAARSYWGLLLCLWTSRLFAVRKCGKATLSQKTRRTRSVGKLFTMLFRAALRSFLSIFHQSSTKNGPLFATGVISEGRNVHHDQQRFVGHRPSTMNRCGRSSQVCPVTM